MLEKCFDLKMLRNALVALPTTLEETYARILNSIDACHRDYAVRILQFLTYSERPLRIDEAVDIVAVDITRKPSFDSALRMPDHRDIMRVCSSLVTLTTRSGKYPEDKILRLQLAHFSVQQYLSSGRIAVNFPEPVTTTGTLFESGLNEFNARAHIAKVCLAYLMFLGGLKPCMVNPRPWAGFPFAQYSARYWMSHARFSETDKDIQERALNLFQHRYAYEAWSSLLFLGRPSGGEPLDPLWMETSLHYASFAGLRNTAMLLLDRGADVNAQGFCHGSDGSALHAASGEGHLNVVRLLLDRGANVNAQYSHGRTALHVASFQGHLKIVQLLLQREVDTEAQDGLYGTALQAASSGGHADVVLLLLERGADVDAQCGMYKTAIAAASIKGHTQIVQLLLERRANVDIPNSDHNSALYGASSRGHTKIVQLLLDKGTDVRSQCQYFGAALVAASGNGYIQIVKLLLEKGTDVNSRGQCGSTALIVASREGHRKIVQLLLKKGADINSQHEHDNSNALVVASGEGHTKVAKLLIKSGADVNTQDRYSGTALICASEGSYRDRAASPRRRGRRQFPE